MTYTNSGTPTAEEVFRLIEKMPPAERDRLFTTIEHHPDLSDKWTAICIEVLLHLAEGQKMVCHILHDMTRLAVEYGNKDWARSKCSRVKRDKTTQRDEAIDRARDAGIEEPEAILRHLQEQHPELVRNVQNADVMMRDYHKRKQGSTNCNPSD